MPFERLRAQVVQAEAQKIEEQNKNPQFVRERAIEVARSKYEKMVKGLLMQAVTIMKADWTFESYPDRRYCTWQMGGSGNKGIFRPTLYVSLALDEQNQETHFVVGFQNTTHWINCDITEAALANAIEEMLLQH